MKKQINLYNFAAKDELRPAMNGVYFDADYSVAVVCDSHIMVCSESHFQEEKAGHIIGREDDDIIAKYPRWADIIMPCVKSVKEKDGDYTEINPAVVAGAFQNATNFAKNVPSTWSDGKKIKKNERTICVVLPFVTSDGEGKAVVLKYDYLKKLEGQGLRWYAKDERRAVYFENEAGDFYGLLMPIACGVSAYDNYTKAYYGIDKAICQGIYNPTSEDERFYEDERKTYYIGHTYISANCISAEAVRLFATPEKRERVPQAKCIEANRKSAAAVKIRPASAMVPWKIQLPSSLPKRTAAPMPTNTRPVTMWSLAARLHRGARKGLQPVFAEFDNKSMAETFALLCGTELASNNAKWVLFAERTGAVLPTDNLEVLAKDLSIAERELEAVEESRADYLRMNENCGGRDYYVNDISRCTGYIAEYKAIIEAIKAKIAEISGTGAPVPSESAPVEMPQVISEMPQVATEMPQGQTNSEAPASTTTEGANAVEKEREGAFLPESGENQKISSQNPGTGTPPRKRKRPGLSFLEIALCGKTIYAWRSAKTGLTSRRERRQRLLHGRASPSQNPPTYQSTLNFESLIPNQYENSFRTSFPHGKQGRRGPDLTEAPGGRRYRGMGRCEPKRTLRLTRPPGRFRGTRDGPDYHGKFQGPFEPREGRSGHSPGLRQNTLCKGLQARENLPFGGRFGKAGGGLYPHGAPAVH